MACKPRGVLDNGPKERNDVPDPDSTNPDDTIENPLNPTILTGRTTGIVNDFGWPESPPTAPYTWQNHPCSMNENNQCMAGETFADMFVLWTYYSYWIPAHVEEISYTYARRDFMNRYMPLWISLLYLEAEGLL